MSKSVLSLFAVIIVFLPKLCETAVAIYPKQDKPPEFACQQGCFLKELSRVIGYKETFYNVGKECASYECRTSGETIQYTCGAIAAGPGCKVVKGNINLEYPKCCPSVVCAPKSKEPECTLPIEKPPC